MNDRRSSRGRWLSMAISIVFATMFVCGMASAANVATSSGDTTYGAGGSPVTVDPSITASGSDANPDATVEISTGFQSGDVLSGGGGSWDGGKGILTITDATDWADLQSDLRSVTFDTTSGSISDRTITFTVGADLGNSLYYPGTDHYYEFVPASGIDWTDAKPAAESKSYAGLNGYLATVSSSGENDFIAAKLSGEGWMGASDATTENAWYWVTGPESGTQFWQGDENGNVVGGRYNNWLSVEPNDYGSGEDYAHFVSNGYWNDYSNTQHVDGYVVEYGGPGFGGGASESSSMDTKTIIITSNSPPTGITLSSSDVDENQPSGTAVGSFTTTDPDSGDTHTYTLVTGTGSGDNSDFSINSNQLETAASFDYETKNSCSIRVRSTDSGSQYYEKEFTVTVNDVNEVPYIPISPLCEGQTNPTDVTYFTPEFSWTFSDPDAGNTQGAYQVIVGTSTGSSNMWNPGKVSISSGSIYYAGSALTPGTTYYWKVKTWDNYGAEGSYCADQTFITIGPTMALDDVNGIIRDWGRDVSLNHSVTAANAVASNVNVTYNVSWIEGCAFGTVDKDATKYCNRTIKNSTVQQITVKVDATTTTGSATNASETFSINITRRAIVITADPIAPQSVNPNTTFRINGSAEGEYGETFTGFAYLVREGLIIDNMIITDGNANFSRTEPAEGTFNFSIRFHNTSHYNNKTTSDATMHIVDDTPPASITGIGNLTTEQSRIHWTWTDPTDADFAGVMIYINGTFKTNVSKGVRNYTATGLTPDTNYMIGMHTVDDKGNLNRTWVNGTARTLPFSGLQHINVTPDSWTMNISESVNFNATGYDHNDDPIDPSNLTFTWYTTPAGVGTLDATTGAVVAFTARHAGRTEIYAVNGSVSSNAKDLIWITVNAPTKTGNVANGTGNATSGNSTATVWLNNTSISGMILIEEIGDPLNKTEDRGNRIGLGSTKSVKGANVTVTGSIEVALNDAGGYVHIGIEYNESQVGDIDENTLYIYKFVNGTGWVKMLKDTPSYCVANGRNTTANYVWVNVTNCSKFLLTGIPKATPSDSSGSREGTYPSGWFGTPTPVVTATKAPASANATATPPDERVTPSPTKAKPAAARATTPAAEGAAEGDAKNGAPGFTAVFVIAGVLAVAYAMMRRRG